MSGQVEGKAAKTIKVRVVGAKEREVIEILARMKQEVIIPKKPAAVVDLFGEWLK